MRDFIDYLYIWFITALEIATYTIIVAVLVAIFALALTGCPCPPEPPPRVVLVSKPCPLPPTPALPVVQTLDAGDAKLFCYDMSRALLLAQRDSLMRSWIKEVIARCGSAPDAGVAGNARSSDQ